MGEVRGLAAALIAAALLCGCVPRASTSDQSAELVFGGAPADLFPHQPGNRFVYRARGDAGERTLTALVSGSDRDEEFLVTLFQGDLVLGQTRIRDDGRSLAIVSEVGPQQNLAAFYREPLPLAVLPLRTGEQPPFRTAVKIVALSDGSVVTEGQIEQTSRVEERRRSFGRKGWFLIHFERTMVLSQRITRSRSTIWVEPGVGQVRIEMAGAAEEPSERRDLVCAVIGGREVGDCGKLEDDLQ
jgi:hypothetical protein